jgi:hypothetical protein
MKRAEKAGLSVRSTTRIEQPQEPEPDPPEPAEDEPEEVDGEVVDEPETSKQVEVVRRRRKVRCPTCAHMVKPEDFKRGVSEADFRDELVDWFAQGRVIMRRMLDERATQVPADLRSDVGLMRDIADQLEEGYC